MRLICNDSIYKHMSAAGDIEATYSLLGSRAVGVKNCPRLGGAGYTKLTKLHISCLLHLLVDVCEGIVMFSTYLCVVMYDALHNVCRHRARV